MTAKEQIEQLQQAKLDFYAWRPGPEDDPERRFRCHHIPSRPMVHGAMCRARARKPEIFRMDCSGCPRWRHWRKLAKKSRKIPYKTEAP